MQVACSGIYLSCRAVDTGTPGTRSFQRGSLLGYSADPTSETTEIW